MQNFIAKGFRHLIVAILIVGAVSVRAQDITDARHLKLSIESQPVVVLSEDVEFQVQTGIFSNDWSGKTSIKKGTLEQYASTDSGVYYVDKSASFSGAFGVGKQIAGVYVPNDKKRSSIAWAKSLSSNLIYYGSSSINLSLLKQGGHLVADENVADAGKPCISCSVQGGIQAERPDARNENLFDSEETIDKQRRLKMKAEYDAFYDYPIGKTYWIEPKLNAGHASSRIALYQTLHRDKIQAYDFFSGPMYPKHIMSLVPLERICASRSNVTGKRTCAYAVRLENGSIAYIRGELFGEHEGASYEARSWRVKTEYQGDALDEKLYAENPAELKIRMHAKEEANLKALAIAEKKHAAKGGVRIGMSKKQVLASNWGKPSSVNRTTSANGTAEQWVYDGSYLYFQNGILRTIQN